MDKFIRLEDIIMEKDKIKIINNKFNFLIRTFLGIGYFITTSVVEKIIKGWFRSLEWSVVTTALFLIGLKFPYPFNNFFFLIGVVSLIFLFIYNINFWWNEVEAEYSISIEKVNKRNSKIFKDKFVKYNQFPSLSAVFPLLLIMLIINIVTFFMMFFSLLYFI